MRNEPTLLQYSIGLPLPSKAIHCTASFVLPAHFHPLAFVGDGGIEADQQAPSVSAASPIFSFPPRFSLPREQGFQSCPLLIV